MRRSSLRTSGLGGSRKGLGCSGRVAPGPLPAPHRATQLGPQFPQLLRSGAVPHQQHQDSITITRNNHSVLRASCLLTQLRSWVVPGRDSSSSAVSVRRVPSLHSKVKFNLAAIPPGTLVLTLRRQDQSAWRVSSNGPFRPRPRRESAHRIPYAARHPPAPRPSDITEGDVVPRPKGTKGV